MGDHREHRPRRCEGRPRRRIHDEGFASPFSCDTPVEWMRRYGWGSPSSEGELSPADAESELDLLQQRPASEPEEEGHRITMMVIRDGFIYEASCRVYRDCEGLDDFEWWAIAIAAFDTSVDMAQSDSVD